MARSTTVTIVATYTPLVLACVASFLLPRTLLLKSVSADDAPDEDSLPGLVRDFSSSHPDFNVFPDQGLGHDAENIGQGLITGDRAVQSTAYAMPDLDRLGLQDGQACDLHVFYADRSPVNAVFRLRTNIELNASNLPTINSMFD